MHYFSAAVLGLLLTVQSTIHSSQELDKESLIEEMHAIGVVEFGNFVLKVSDGYINTPIYIDMRKIISHPTLMNKIVNMIDVAAKNLEYDIVCGVPYAAVPYAAGFSLYTNKPMVMSRQRAKQYGTGKMVEGSFNQRDKVLLIEDVIVSGASILSASDTLRHAGLETNDVIILCDRQQGACEKMIERGLKPHVIFTLSEILEVLEKKEKLSRSTGDEVKKYIAEHQCK